MEQIRLVLTREMVRRLQEETEAVVGWRPVEVKEEKGRALEAAVRLETPVREKTPDKMERGRSSSKKKINITLNSSAKR